MPVLKDQHVSAFEPSSMAESPCLHLCSAHSCGLHPSTQTSHTWWRFALSSPLYDAAGGQHSWG